MDFIVTSHKNKPFVDGKFYPKICFCCYHVPAQFVDGEGPFYSHRHLNLPEDLFENQTAASLREAEKCLEGVKRACRSVGAKALDKLKLVRPNPEYEHNPEHEANLKLKWEKELKKKTKRKINI